MKKMSIKQGDKVIVPSGKDKGKIGEVLTAMPALWQGHRSGCQRCSRHTKPRKMGDEGGIIQKEGAIYACKVMRVCPKCEKPTRPAHKLLADGKKVRVCKKCGAEI